MSLFEEVKNVYTKGSHRKVSFKCPTCGESTVRQFRTCINTKHCSECFTDIAKSRKKNHIPISLEEAHKMCSKGSSQLVFWECLDCDSAQTKTYKQALKVVRCKPCNNKIRPKTDFSGKNNPMYGVSLPGSSGSANPNWDPSLSEEERALRKEHRYTGDHKAKIWSKSIKELADFICDSCGTKKSPFNSHHLNGWKRHPEQRYDLSNGVCLCVACHKKFHKAYGRGDNTETQYERFQKAK